MKPEPKGRVRIADGPEDKAAVKAIFLDYLRFVEAFLGESLSFQGTDAEFANFGSTYDVMCLAELNGSPVGACAVKPFADDICELKRLFVRAAGRGEGFGRSLTELAITEARALGYATIYLDTNEGLIHANAIYEALGFVDIEPYYDNPLGRSSRYMALNIRNNSSRSTGVDKKHL